MEKLSELIKRKPLNSSTDNSKDKSLNTVNSIDTVNSKETFDSKLNSLLEEYSSTPEGQAILLAELLNDTDSVKYYEILIKENPPTKLFELAHYAKDRDLSGKVQTKRAVYFLGILRKLGYKIKFKK